MNDTSRVKRGYRTAAVAWLNITLILVLAVLVLNGSLKWLGSHRGPSSLRIVRKYTLPVLQQVYPQYRQDQMIKLLEESWTRTYQFRPFLQFAERPFQGTYVRVDRHGFRYGAEPLNWPPAPTRFNIFFFGGSTAFGYGVADHETIAAALQRRLGPQGGRPVAVYNFGCGYYYSIQERLLFEQLLLDGHRPDLAIFLDGLNEFYHPEADALFTPQLKAFVDQDLSLGEAFESTRTLRRFPLLLALGRWLQQLNERLGARHVSFKGAAPAEPPPADPPPATPGVTPPEADSIAPAMVQRYLRNREMIQALANHYGVAAVFVWQPVPMYHYDLRYHVLGGTHFDEVWERLGPEGYAWLDAYRATNDLGRAWIWAADMQANEKTALYVDKAHYSAAMSDQVAAFIAGELAGRGWMAPAGGTTH